MFHLIIFFLSELKDVKISVLKKKNIYFIQ